MPEIKSKICFLTTQKMQLNFPLFVFLPGLDGTGQLLRSQTIGLTERFDVRCLAIPPDDLNNWEILTRETIELVETEIAKGRPDRPVYLCGESFGGCLALKMILQAPHLFQRLILVNPASSFNRKPLLSWGSQFVPWLPEFFQQWSLIGFLPFLASLERMRATDRRELLDTIRMVPQRTSVWRLELLREFSVTEAELRSITQPTLLVGSATDRLLPSLSEVTYLAEMLPQAQVFVLPNSGHACLLEMDVNLYEIMKQQHFLADGLSFTSSSFDQQLSS